MLVESTPPHSGERPYIPPAITPLGTLADLTRGTGGLFQTDALGDASGDEGSV